MASTSTYTRPLPYATLYAVATLAHTAFGNPGPAYHAVPYPANAPALEAAASTATPAQLAWLAGVAGEPTVVPPGWGHLAPVAAWVDHWLGEG